MTSSEELEEFNQYTITKSSATFIAAKALRIIRPGKR